MNRTKRIAKLARGYEIVKIDDAKDADADAEAEAEVVTEEDQEGIENLKENIAQLVLKKLAIQKTRDSSKNGLAYLGHHFFPDKFGPVRYPDFMAFPTHLHKDRIESVLIPGLDRKCLLVWQPTASLCYQTSGAFVPYYFNDVEAAGATLIGGNYLSYNGATTNVNGSATGSGVLAVNGVINTTSWPKAHIGIKTAVNIKKTRLLSAYIKIEYTGKTMEASGVLRVGMGVKKANDNLNGFKLADITSLPIYSSFDGDEDLFLQYRHADELNYQMGPFPEDTFIPYIIVYGEGLSTTASYKITSFRTFESIVDENMMELVNPLKEDADSHAQTNIKTLYGQFLHSPIMSDKAYKNMSEEMDSKKLQTLEIKNKLPNSLNQLRQYYNVLQKENLDVAKWSNSLRDWGYLLHHYFPDRVSGKRFPDALAFPTNISSHKTEVIIPVSSDGRIAIYFNPALSCTDQTRAYFACNGTANITLSSAPGAVVAGNIVDFTSQQFFEPTNNSSLNPNAWPTKYFGYPSSDKYKQVRLISAFLKIEYIGKPLDNAGYTRVCMFPKAQIESGDSKMSVKPSSMQNQPIYGSFKGDEDLLTFYRHIDDTFYTMGPYPINSLYPVTLLYGEGMTSGASYKVVITRTFEGIPLDNLTEFTNPLKEEVSNVGSGVIKSNYNLINVPPFSRVDEYESIAADTLRNFDEDVLQSLSTNQRILNLYNKVSEMSSYASPNPLPAYDITHTDMVALNEANMTEAYDGLRGILRRDKTSKDPDLEFDRLNKKYGLSGGWINKAANADLENPDTMTSTWISYIKSAKLPINDEKSAIIIASTPVGRAVLQKVIYGHEYSKLHRKSSSRTARGTVA